MSPSGMVSLMGGKLTSFRTMGVDTVDAILKMKQMETKYEESQTLKFNLIGTYSRMEVASGLRQQSGPLYQQYEDHLLFVYDLPRDVCKSLIERHGTTALRVVKLGQESKLNEKLHPEFPHLKSEVLYAARHELAEKPNDVLCRRMPIGLLN